MNRQLQCLPVFGLEARVQTGEEGMVGRQSENPLLGHRALHVVVLDDHILLQHLHTPHIDQDSCEYRGQAHRDKEQVREGC